MNKKNAIITVVLFISMFIVSCDNYLDVAPDNRAEIDSKKKVEKLLVSAYPYESDFLLAELVSDNVDDYNSQYFDRFFEEVFYWKEVKESNNESPERFWGACYNSIAAANQALLSIEKMGNTKELQPHKGEALIARAYAHFLLVNYFALHYNQQTSATDLGIVYMEKPETTLNPSYKRESVKSIYEKINKDIEEGLPLIDDDSYGIPKYHFNRAAAYAFAARFNLYYEKWDKALAYANEVLPTDASGVLRDWKTMGKKPTWASNQPGPRQLAYVSADSKANLLLLNTSSSLGYLWGAYYFGARFSHGEKLANEETLFAPNFFKTGLKRDDYLSKPGVFHAGVLDKTLFQKIPFLFQVTDPVANIGYWRTALVAFSTEETLLVRAEANIMKKNYAAALTDINVWLKNFYVDVETVTLDKVNTFYNGIEYYTQELPTPKKQLSPAFAIEQGTQENMIHAVLACRRILTLHEGLRWYDVKRYGIEIYRRVIDRDGVTVTETKDVLKKDDPRRAMQLPLSVIKAGITPNPR